MHEVAGGLFQWFHVCVGGWRRVHDAPDDAGNGQNQDRDADGFVELVKPLDLAAHGRELLCAGTVIADCADQGAVCFERVGQIDHIHTAGNHADNGRCDDPVKGNRDSGVAFRIASRMRCHGSYSSCRNSPENSTVTSSPMLGMKAVMPKSERLTFVVASKPITSRSPNQGGLATPP